MLTFTDEMETEIGEGKSVSMTINEIDPVLVQKAIQTIPLLENSKDETGIFIGRWYDKEVQPVTPKQKKDILAIQRFCREKGIRLGDLEISLSGNKVQTGFSGFLSKNRQLEIVPLSLNDLLKQRPYHTVIIADSQKDFQSFRDNISEKISRNGDICNKTSFEDKGIVLWIDQHNDKQLSLSLTGEWTEYKQQLLGWWYDLANLKHAVATEPYIILKSAFEKAKAKKVIVNNDEDKAILKGRGFKNIVCKYGSSESLVRGPWKRCAGKESAPIYLADLDKEKEYNRQAHIFKQYGMGIDTELRGLCLKQHIRNISLLVAVLECPDFKLIEAIRQYHREPQPEGAKIK